MKKRMAFLFLLAASLTSTMAQTTITLEYCQQQALANYPLIKQKDLLSEVSDLRLRNITKAWYPQLYVNGQSTIQSDVTELPIDIPFVEIPELNKDSYRITLDVSQTIYDGGVAGAQKKIERASLETEKQSLEVDLYQIRDRVNQIYFSILLMQQNEKIILSVRDELLSRLKKVEAGVRDEVVLQMSADILNAEILKVEQQLIEILSAKKTGLKVLSEFINQSLPEVTELTIPFIVNQNMVFDNQRPEMKLFELQQSKLDVSEKMVSTRLLPRISAFGQAGYGSPGLNMLSNGFNTWGVFGVKFSWNIWNWNYSYNEKRILNLQKDMVSLQKETFEKNLKMLLEKDAGEIEKYEGLIDKDKEIILLREKITATAANQLESGVITATEYITEMNAEVQARLNLELHKVQLQSARATYLTRSGKM